MNKPTSIYLDLMRLCAAGTVFAVHANYDRFVGGLPVLWRLQNLGNDAVMVFFVISGFVIAYVAEEKERTPAEYVASRLARLYSVAIPALVLTVILDYIGQSIDPGLYAGPWFQADAPFWRFLANLFFVNEIWFFSVRPFTNGPYWSLGYEFWYYILFAVAYYLRGTLRFILLVVVCFFVGPKILILFPVWLLGVWVYHLVRRPCPRALGWALFLGSIVTYLVFRQGGYPQILLDWTVHVLGKGFVEDRLAWSQYFLSSYVIGIIVAANFVGAASVSDQFLKPLAACEGVIRYLASFTFAIYLFHFPCLQFFAAVATVVSDPLLGAALVIGGTIIAIWLLGSVTERKRGDLKVVLLRATNAIVRRSHGV